MWLYSNRFSPLSLSVKTLLTTLFFVLFSCPIWATDYVWATTSSGDWSVPGNWIQNSGYPGVTSIDTASIQLPGTGPYTVRLDVDALLNSVVLNSSNATFLIGPDRLLQLTGGTGSLTATAGTISMDATATVELLSGATLNTGAFLVPSSGATLSVTNGVFTSGTVLPVELSVWINAHGEVSINSLLINETIISMQASSTYGSVMLLTGDTLLSGGGSIQSSASPYNRINGSGSERFTNVDNTIQISGNIGYDSTLITNQGTFDANALAMTVDPLDGPGITMLNQGTMQATNGGSLTCAQGIYDNTGGTIQALTSGHVILSQGTFDNSGSTIQAVGSGSKVTLSSAGQITGGDLIATSGGFFIINAGTIKPGSARDITNLRAEDTSVVELRGWGTLEVGALYETTGTGSFDIYDGIFPDGFTIHSDLNLHIKERGTLKLPGNLINQSTVYMEASNNFGSIIQLTGNVSLSGGGTILSTTSAHNRIDGSGSERLTNVDNTIQITGNIGYNSLLITNQGTFDANALAMTVDPLDGPGITMLNQGTMQATNGGTLTCAQGIYDNTGGTIQALTSGHVILSQGTFDNSGSTIQAVGSGSKVTLSSAGQITGGDLIATSGASFIVNAGTIKPGSARDITNLRAEDTSIVELRGWGTLEVGALYETTGTGSFDIYDGILSAGFNIHSDLNVHIKERGTLKLPGNLINQNTVYMESSNNYGSIIQLTGNVSLSGGGTILSTTSPHNRINGSGSERLTNVDNTIQITGNIGYNSTLITNQGTFDANALAMTVDPLDGPGTTMLNQGTMQATNGGTLTLAPGSYDNSFGQILALDASSTQLLNGVTLKGGFLNTQGTGIIQATSNTLSMVTNLGELSITSGLTLENYFINNGEVNMNGLTMTVGPGVRLSGTGTINGPVLNDGTVSPGGSPGTLTLQSDYVQTVDGVLTIEISQTSNDLLLISGDASLAGSLQVIPINGFVPTVGSQFTILSANTINGSFTGPVLGPCDTSFSVSGTDVIITINTLPIYPDFYVDGQINIQDMIHQMTMYGDCVDCIEDLDCNQTINLDDVYMTIPNWNH